MARGQPIKILRTTRAALNAQAGSAGLLQGELYLITDEDRLAVGLSTTTYETYGKASESSGSWDGDPADVSFAAGADIGEALSATDEIIVANDSAAQASKVAALSRVATFVQGAIKLDDLVGPDDNADLNASTTAHGLVVKATAPSSGLINVVGIANGETAYANKALLDSTNPAALGTVGPGTATVAARRDHVHAMPALSAIGVPTSAVSMSNQDLTGIKSATFNAEATATTTTGAVTINWTTAQNWKQNEPTGAITYTFTAPAGVCHLQLRILSDGTSTAQTITWPETVKWIGATWAGANNKNAIINFWYDGTNYWAMGANEA